MTNHSEKSEKHSQNRISSTSTIRTQLRDKFNNRIKEERYKIIDDHRFIRRTVESIVNQSYDEIKADILSSEDGLDFWTTNEVLDLLNEVQEEVLVEEREERARKWMVDTEEELCYMLDHLASVICCVCDKEINIAHLQNRVICESCAKKCFYDDVM